MDSRVPWNGISNAREKQKSRPSGEGRQSDATITNHKPDYLLLAVHLGVMPAGLDVVMLGVAGMAVGGVRVMRRLLVIASLVMLGGFAMMLGGVLVMLGSLVVMLHALMVAHISLPV